MTREHSYNIRGQTLTGIVNGGIAVDSEWDGDPPVERIQSIMEQWAEHHRVDYVSLVATDRDDKPVAVLVRNPHDLALTRELLANMHSVARQFASDLDPSAGNYLTHRLYNWAEKKGVKL